MTKTYLFQQQFLLLPHQPRYEVDPFLRVASFQRLQMRMETDGVLVVGLELHRAFRLLPVDWYASTDADVGECVVFYSVDLLGLDEVGD